MVTLRIQYTKEAYMKFLGHLELMKLFERVFRRHKYPLKFSEGFNPHPRMTFASPLSVGYASKGEVMEVILDEEMPIERVLSTEFPPGIEVTAAAFVDTKISLMAGIAFSEYMLNVAFETRIPELQPIFEQFLAQDEITYEKKNKKGQLRTIDAKPQIKEAKIVYSDDASLAIKCILQTSSQGNLNPETFVQTFLSFAGIAADRYSIGVERLAMFDERGLTLFNLA